MASNHLFNGRELAADLGTNLKQVMDALNAWNDDDFLARTDADLITELVAVGAVECPALHPDEWYMDERPTEAERSVVNMFGERVRERVVQYTVRIPFSGHPAPFTMKASQYFIAPIEAKVDEKASELVIVWEGTRPDPEAVRQWFRTRIDRIEKGLGFARTDINTHNSNLLNQMPQWVAQRRARLLAARQVHASIGIPIRRRADANVYALPVQRRRLVTRTTQSSRAQANPFEPEPALEKASYEDALAVLRNARNAFERSPSLTEKLGEELIRDLLLILLNAQFEGRAGGELFNCGGKTDILIREKDANVFIGECKIFGPKDGATKITDTIDQLLGYLTWRDTKAALLLFIRDRDVTSVIGKAVAAFEAHPNFKRRGSTASDERYDFVVHANGDPAREMHIAFLPFLVGGAR
ncbi:hypothetical protein [Micromonospora sp. NPDC049107]|uniref:hypothetical protein n=1 Tax=unclassified Micromonospora TaxID=2617518 RepID=UPI0033E066E8